MFCNTLPEVVPGFALDPNIADKHVNLACVQRAYAKETIHSDKHFSLFD